MPTGQKRYRCNTPLINSLAEATELNPQTIKLNVKYLCKTLGIKGIIEADT